MTHTCKEDGFLHVPDRRLWGSLEAVSEFTTPHNYSYTAKSFTFCMGNSVHSVSSFPCDQRHSSLCLKACCRRAKASEGTPNKCEKRSEKGHRECVSRRLSCDVSETVTNNLGENDFVELRRVKMRVLRKVV